MDTLCETLCDKALACWEEAGGDGSMLMGILCQLYVAYHNIIICESYFLPQLEHDCG